MPSQWSPLVTATLWAAMMLGACDAPIVEPAAWLRVSFALPYYPSRTARDLVCDVAARDADGQLIDTARVSLDHGGAWSEFAATGGSLGVERPTLSALVYAVPCPAERVGQTLSYEISLVGAYPEVVDDLGRPGDPAPRGGYQLVTPPPLSARAACTRAAPDPGGPTDPVTVAWPRLRRGTLGHGEVTVVARVDDALARARALAWDLEVYSALDGGSFSDPFVVSAQLPAEASGPGTVRQRYRYDCAHPPRTGHREHDSVVEIYADLTAPAQRPHATPLSELPRFSLFAKTSCDAPEAATLIGTPATWASSDPTDGRVRFGSLVCEPTYRCARPESPDALRGSDGGDDSGGLVTARMGLRCFDDSSSTAPPPSIYFGSATVRCAGTSRLAADIPPPALGSPTCPHGAGTCDGELVKDVVLTDAPLPPSSAASSSAPPEDPESTVWQLSVGLDPALLRDQRCAISVTATAVAAGEVPLAEREPAELYPTLSWSMRLGGGGDAYCGPRPGSAWDAPPSWGLRVAYRDQWRSSPSGPPLLPYRLDRSTASTPRTPATP